jgi:hypothetical protein
MTLPTKDISSSPNELREQEARAQWKDVWEGADFFIQPRCLLWKVTCCLPPLLS